MSNLYKIDENLLSKLQQIISRYLHDTHNRHRKVVNYQKPEDLKKLFDFDISTEWVDDDQILRLIDDIIHYSVANQHPRFFSALRWGASIYSIVGEWLTAVMGTTMYTYEVAPLFTLMEEYMYSKIAISLWRKDNHDGMMLPGGATVNLYALQLARYALNPEYHQSGMYNTKELVIYTSDQSHYSITKSAILMWLGKNNVIKIVTNEKGEMSVDDLEIKILQSISMGKQPLLINATSGTTVLWAYDDLELIWEIAKKYNIWYHVDAIWWWWVLFNDWLRHKMNWIKLADSMWRNPHKMIWATIQCSVFMTQHKDKNLVCNALKSPYLFNDDKKYDACYDTWDKYVQCGRRVDVLKLWIQRKALGDQGISEYVQTAFDNVAYLKSQIDHSDQLLMAHDPDCLNVCFWYVPTHLVWKITRETIWEYFDEIHQITAQIHAQILSHWEMMTMFTTTKNLPNFFRLAIVSPRVTHEDLDFVVQHIQELGLQIENE